MVVAYMSPPPPAEWDRMSETTCWEVEGYTHFSMQCFPSVL